VAIGLVILLVLTKGFRRRPPVMDFSEDDPAPLLEVKTPEPTA
jgi:hypothetical protein